MTLRALAAGLRTLFRRRDVDREIDDEIAHYIEQATNENIRRGMTPTDAERAARVQMGSVAGTHEQALSVRWEAGVERRVLEIGYAGTAGQKRIMHQRCRSAVSVTIR